MKAVYGDSIPLSRHQEPDFQHGWKRTQHYLTEICKSPEGAIPASAIDVKLECFSTGTRFFSILTELGGKIL